MYYEILKAVLLGVVQGVTEWLPISSTGHMILVNEFIRLNFSPDFINLFLVVVQFGSILAVVLLYFHKLNPLSPKKSPKEKMETFNLWLKVLVGIVPVGIVGVLFGDQIQAIFYGPVPVAVALIVYGVLFIVIESMNRKPKIESLSRMGYKTALLIGVCQMLSVIPGTSRSGSTILGATLLGTSRSVAAEFSFFLAVPVMFGASLLKLLKASFVFTGEEIAVLLTGTAVSFVVSIFAIKFLMGYIKKHDFKAFGYYRIVLGILVLLYFTVVK